MSVTEIVHKASELTQTGNYKEALKCLIDARKSDPWNGYILDLSRRVEKLYELSKLNRLSLNDVVEFKAWLPGILQRIGNSTTTLQPIHPNAPSRSGDTPASSPDTINPEHDRTGVAGASIEEPAVTRNIPTIVPGDQITSDRDRLLSELAKRQVMKSSPPVPSKPAARSADSGETQEFVTRPFGVVNELRDRSPVTPDESVEPPRVANPPTRPDGPGEMQEFVIRPSGVVNELRDRSPATPDESVAPPRVVSPPARSAGSGEMQEFVIRPSGVVNELRDRSPATPDESVEPPRAANPPDQALPESPFLYPPVSDEEWRAETEGAQGAFEALVKLPESWSFRRKVLIVVAILALLLIVAGGYYALRGNRSVSVRPVQMPGSTSQPLQNSNTGLRSNKVQTQPTGSISAPDRVKTAKGNQSSAVPLSVKRGSEKKATGPSSIAGSSRERTTTSSREQMSAKRPATHTPTTEIPIAPATASAPVDTASVITGAGVAPSPPAGPNKVTVRVYIGADGRPLRAEIISSTDPSYNNAAIETAMKATFAPGSPRVVVTGFIYP